MPDWDVQFMYWKYADGVYGAAVPLSSNTYRTTLGSENSKWGSKSSALVAEKAAGIMPCIAIGFGQDPYELFARVYKVALVMMGRNEDLISGKKLPEIFNYFGWCTYNAVSPAPGPIVAAVKSFADHKFPIGFVLVDGGWMQSKSQQLQTFTADLKLVPQGFKAMNHALKNELGVKYCGIWHTLNGDFNGIDSASELGRHYSSALFSWLQPVDPSSTSPNLIRHFFIRPESDSLLSFWRSWYRYFKNEGFDFTKVDNQLVVERMAVNNYPIMELSAKMHQAMYRASAETFQSALINCMDMTADAYLNFGTSAVARGVEDYFPYTPGETYDMQRGNAAAHVLQAIYNNLYFSQWAYSDFDMFQSHNPNAYLHALARACNNGPIYCTDLPGKQNFDVLRPLVYKDGRIVHSQTALRPTEDCLFQVQGNKLFKSFSKVGKSGLVFVMNAADTSSVSGTVSPLDIRALTTRQFLCYEYFSKAWRLMSARDTQQVRLGRLGYKLYEIIPVEHGFAPIGLTQKYIGPATIVSCQTTSNSARITLYEDGEFSAYLARRPKSVLVNGRKSTNYVYNKGLLVMRLRTAHPNVRVLW